MQSFVTECGIRGIGKVPWGNHLCHFFQTRGELEESVVSYFQAGLLQGERCIWGCASPLEVEQAKAALRKELPTLDRYLNEDRLVFFDHQEWYRGSDRDPIPLLLEEEKKSLEMGLTGLRAGGNCSWIEAKDHPHFMDYEGRISHAIRNRRILALCSYNLENGVGSAIMEAMRRHDYTLSKGRYGWELLERLHRG